MAIYKCKMCVGGIEITADTGDLIGEESVKITS